MSITFDGGDRVFNNKKDSSTCLFSCVDAIRTNVLADDVVVVVVSVLVAFLFLRG